MSPDDALRYHPELFLMEDEPALKFVKEEGVIKLTPKNFFPLMKYYEKFLYLYCGKRFANSESVSGQETIK
jgi:hypothetical protein